MRIHFTKMHGAGNDFMVFERTAGAPLPTAEQWRRLADRHRGIGFDQAIVFEPARDATTAAYYRVFNADGGEVEQCGNGARCAVLLLKRQGRMPGDSVSLGSLGGIIAGRVVDANTVSIDMGPPRLEPAALPFSAPARALQYPIEVAGRQLEIGAVSMGNPHAVLQVTDVASAPVRELGEALQRHARFPQSVNVGFMQVIDAAHILLRVFERGVGETLACGTGICAAVVFGRNLGLLGTDVAVHVPGGDLRVHWDGGDSSVWLTGPAAVAFEGQVDLP
jgi:diaminopimelate epimerase